MPHVVTDSCINCKHTSCAPVCPTECFHEGPNFLVINPDECIDCGLCVVECPIDAIVDAAALSADQQHWIEVNASLSRTWPIILRQKEAAPEADKWADVKDKLALLQR